MSKAVVTFTDTKGGNVNVTIDFTPEVTDASDSPAQLMAVRMLDALKGKHEETEDEGA